MAIAFEMSMNFGSNLEAAESFCRKELPVLEVGSYNIELHKPLLSQIKAYRGNTILEVSVLPVAVGCGVAIDQGHARIRLDTQDLTELGSKLYELIRGVPGYSVALAGWDADYQIDLEELCEEWTEEIKDGSLHGLVVSHGARKRLPSHQHFVPFDDEHDWIPYQGTKAIP